MLTTHRGHGHSIAKGTRLPEMLAELMGKVTGLCRSKGGSMHIADVSKGHYGAHSIVGANMPMAAGIGLAFQLEGKDRVAVVFFGDGASNNGAFHEAMNLCAIWKLPVVFFCENNQYAVSVPAEYSTSVDDISVRSKGYDAPGLTGGRHGRGGGLRGEPRSRGPRAARCGPEPDRSEDVPVFRPLARRSALRHVPHERGMAGLERKETPSSCAKKCSK